MDQSSSKGLAAQSACDYCRHLKMRCIRNTEDTDNDKCQRCTRLGKDCVVNVRKRPGRRRGSKNKKTLLAQAQLAKSKDTSMDGTLSSIPITSNSLNSKTSSVSSSPSPPDNQANPVTTEFPLLPVIHSHLPPPPPTPPQSMSECDPPSVSSQQAATVELAPGSQSSHNVPPVTASMDTISNPLGLLAEVSEAEFNSPNIANQRQQLDMSNIYPLTSSLQPKLKMLLNGNIDPRISRLKVDQDILLSGLEFLASADHSALPSVQDLNSYQFRPSRTVRDLGHDLDPLDSAVISDREARQYFDVFHQHLHPLITILDPNIHTLEFIRSRSAFLLTVVCLNGAQFSRDSEAVCKRLQQHANKLVTTITEKRYMSLELVQAFLLWLPWLPASTSYTEDNLWRHTAQVMDMALRLRIDKPYYKNSDGGDDLSDAIFENIDTSDLELVVRMKRNKERTWLRFFLWEAGLTAAFGRSSTFVENDLIKNEDWYIHPLACEYDKDTCALVRLRRFFITLANDVKTKIKMNPEEGTDWVLPFIDESLNPWHQKWVANVGQKKSLPISRVYNELIYLHGRVWLLTCALNLTERSNMDVDTLSRDCLNAALEGCHTAVKYLHASKGIWYMPNTLAPMISFAAVLCLRLFECINPHDVVASQANLIGILAHLAFLLEKVGTTPPHRSGTAAIYGRRLTMILRTRMIGMLKIHADMNGTNSKLPSRVASRISSPLYSTNGTTPGNSSTIDPSLDPTNRAPQSSAPSAISTHPTLQPAWIGNTHSRGGNYGGDPFMGGWNDEVRSMMDLLWPEGDTGTEIYRSSSLFGPGNEMQGLGIIGPDANGSYQEPWPDDVRNMISVITEPWQDISGNS